MSDDQARRDALRVFQKDVGTWDAELTITPGPGAPPIVQTGVSQNRLLGDSWLIVDYRAASGFEGHGVYGWDDLRRCYIGTWIDSVSPTMARLEGSWDIATRTMSFTAETLRDGNPFRYREVTRTLDEGVQLYQNLVPLPGGGEFELIRTIYRRK